jgi:hypothetical protein
MKMGNRLTEITHLLSKEHHHKLTANLMFFTSRTVFFRKSSSHVHEQNETKFSKPLLCITSHNTVLGFRLQEQTHMKKEESHFIFLQNNLP